MNLKFSVITPSFCQGRFIDRTIKSVLSQNIPDMEYIICDGGSDDETLEVIQKYSDKIRWVSEPDKGQADAVNKGISLTSGEIIAWINSDDIYYPNAFSTVKHLFESNSEIEVIYGHADWIDEYDQVLQQFPTESWNYQYLKEICFISQPAVFFRRSLIQKYGNLDASLNYCMDYELWLRYGEYVPFYQVPQKFAGSRMYKTNKTLGKRLEAHCEINQMLKQKFGRVPDCWLFAYSLMKVEETTNLNKFDNTQLREFTKVLIHTTLEEFYHYQNQISAKLLLKIIFWWLFPHLSWFRRSS
ncbi:hypothetical protein DSM106972_018580 [Dulcicalothrix desertica PCC 7102]|uniref:Glycosyltransferase 2-like domain-containing protein n=1 Tax=Dulcicalothrix desertica PCC 7102 TaxID=232991 RepID=A0A433VN92_9CYAN|nr:glycosyltransferase family 2 protein [Dulcicalothrix desertica]RUT07598.1 hypothetical protein DSM106972_018580 [Dulcicalothrix desertica PCC 7102]TWH39767.1 glycosyltransferase involved in cell wall biosynthesis [Dulcicalothrix desertica PCC 7102]